jgi:hypothetical protein
MLTQPSEGSDLNAKSALRGSVLRANSQHAFRRSDGDAVALLQAGKEAAHGVWCPGHGRDDLRYGRSRRTAQHRQHLCLLGAFARWLYALGWALPRDNSRFVHEGRVMLISAWGDCEKLNPICREQWCVLRSASQFF